MLDTVNPDVLTLAIITKWFEADLHSVPSNSVAGLDSLTSGTYVVGSHSGAKGFTEAQAQSAYHVNRKFHHGDHWQEGAQWAGQLPRGENKQPDLQALADIGRAFVSQNLIKSSTDRHVAGVAGREAYARALDEDATVEEQAEDAITADDEETEAETPADAINGLVAEWMDRRNFQELLQQYATALCLAGTAPGRLFVPTGRLARKAGRARGQELKPGDPITVPAMGFEEAMGLIYAEVAEPGRSGVYTDPHTGDKYAAHIYTVGEVEYVDITYLDDEGRTLHVLIREAGGTPVLVEQPMELGGALLIYQRHRDPLITEQVRQQQRMVNKAFTMMNTNLDWSGFLERIILNAQQPTKKVPDGKGGTKEIPVYDAGAGTAMYLTGVSYEDEDGKTKLANPQVIFREPIKGDVFSQAIDEGKRAVLEETFQLHALISGDAAPSGDSRIQARADFITSLLLTKPALDGFGRWVMETVYRIACHLSGEAVVDSIRMVFRCRIDPGPVMPEEARAIIERVKANLLSRRTALALHGVENVDAELAVLSAEMLHSTEMADRVASWLDAGLNGLAAMVAAGIDEDHAKELLAMPMDVPPGTAPVPPVPPVLPADEDEDDEGAA